MAKPVFKISIFILVLFLSACYTDDSSTPNLNRLPFEDFTEFFNDNNAKADTLTFNADAATTFTTEGGITIAIPENSFSNGGEIKLELKEANSKSDFLLLNKPTLAGSVIIDGGQALSITPIATSINNPLTIKNSLDSGTSIEDLSYYFYQNGWSKEESISIMQENDNLVFETTRTGWQMSGQQLENTNTTQLSVNPFGYGIIPHDVKAFIMFTDQNIVLPLNTDITNVTASGTIPTGSEIHVIVLAMDHFQLTIGTQTITPGGDTSLDLRMSKVSLEEMINLLKDLD